MNATEAKELLSPIPKENFLTGMYTDGEDKCCAVGHLVRLKSDDPDDYSRRNCEDLCEFDTDDDVTSFVRDKVRKFLHTKLDEDEYEPVMSPSPIAIDWEGLTLSEVNNTSSINGYTEDNPKDRVMHLLDDMIEAGY